MNDIMMRLKQSSRGRNEITPGKRTRLFHDADYSCFFFLMHPMANVVRAGLARIGDHSQHGVPGDRVNIVDSRCLAGQRSKFPRIPTQNAGRPAWTPSRPGLFFDIGRGSSLTDKGQLPNLRSTG